MAMDFYQTVMGAKFYNHDFPAQTKAISRLADSVAQLVEQNKISKTDSDESCNAWFLFAEQEADYQQDEHHLTDEQRDQVYEWICMHSEDIIGDRIHTYVENEILD